MAIRDDQTAGRRRLNHGSRAGVCMLGGINRALCAHGADLETSLGCGCPPPVDARNPVQRGFTNDDRIRAGRAANGRRRWGLPPVSPQGGYARDVPTTLNSISCNKSAQECLRRHRTASGELTLPTGPSWTSWSLRVPAEIEK